MPTKKITLDLGQSGEVLFTFTPSEARVHSVSINGLIGSFEALAVVPPLDVDLSVVIQPFVVPICPGASVNIVATIHNKTAYEQSYDSSYYVNGEIVCHSTYNVIAPNATIKGIYTYTVPAIGIYDVRVEVNGFEATTSFEAVEVPVGEPNMSIPSNIITANITVGMSSYCTITVRNIGDGEGNISCDWYLDNAYIETDSASLVPGASAKFTLSTPVLTVGTHIVRAEFAWNGYTETRTGSFVAKTPPSPPGPGTVWGCVIDRRTGVPILNASLSITGIGAIGLSAAGCYEISLDAGRSWDFWCSAPGYRTILWPITPRAGETIKRSFGMTAL